LESAWAARIIKTKEPLEIKDVNIPKQKSDQVLVKVESAGVCHSDLHCGKADMLAHRACL
jgi:D-arabinose 1-dehydrogenase-like Zn-dependent alcohol dehydrogenase